MSELQSYHKVNYSLRPAKAVERKIMLEMLQGLRSFENLREYRYIGFGSIYFSDFSLFHRALGISRMDSMEGNVTDEKRVRFNLPFNCVGLHLAYSTNVLPKLNWDNRVIVWLDYDHELGLYVLGDIETVVQRARSGSVLFVTLDVERRRLDKPKTVDEEVWQEWPKDEDIHERIARLVGQENVSEAAKQLDAREGIWQIYRQIIADKLEQILTRLNLDVRRDACLRAEQFFYMTYKDGALMLTIGYVLFVEADREKLSQSGLLTHPFSATADAHRHVELPNLTIRELHALDRMFPNAKPEDIEGTLNLVPVPKDDLKKFAELYRYFPRYAETTL